MKRSNTFKFLVWGESIIWKKNVKIETGLPTCPFDKLEH